MYLQIIHSLCQATDAWMESKSGSAHAKFMAGVMIATFAGAVFDGFRIL
jgi:hypothetical protein